MTLTRRQRYHLTAQHLNAQKNVKLCQFVTAQLSNYTYETTNTRPEIMSPNLRWNILKPTRTINKNRQNSNNTETKQHEY